MHFCLSLHPTTTTHQCHKHKSMYDTWHFVLGSTFHMVVRHSVDHRQVDVKLKYINLHSERRRTTTTTNNFRNLFGYLDFGYSRFKTCKMWCATNLINIRMPYFRQEPDARWWIRIIWRKFHVCLERQQRQKIGQEKINSQSFHFRYWRQVSSYSLDALQLPLRPTNWDHEDTGKEKDKVLNQTRLLSIYKVPVCANKGQETSYILGLHLPLLTTSRERYLLSGASPPEARSHADLVQQPRAFLLANWWKAHFTVSLSWKNNRILLEFTSTEKWIRDKSRNSASGNQSLDVRKGCPLLPSTLLTS